MKTNRMTSMFKALFGNIPGQLVIQITNRCNGACPQCGMRRNAAITRCSIPPDKIRDTVKQCGENGFEALSLTGGEPCINPDEIFDLLDCAGQVGIPYLRTGTNGYMLAKTETAQITDFAKRLAATNVRNFWISLDSADTKTHEAMRGLPGVTDGIRKALPIFHAHGVYPAANLGINRNIMGEPISKLKDSDDENRFFEEFKTGFEAFFNKAIDLGFTMANLCYPMSSGNDELESPAYGAISDDFIVSFSQKELRLIFKALLAVIPDFRNRIRIFTPLSVLYAMSKEDNAMLFPCFGGIRYFYMDSRDGHIYPCGYLGDRDMGGDLTRAVKRNNREKPSCMKCHWECFRDPSQLFGIARYSIRHPIRVFIQKKTDPIMLRHWIGDLKYYVKHDFFDGRAVPKRQEA